jgi:hypothetical protein
MYLKEVLDNPYPYKVTTDTPDNIQVIFDTDYVWFFSKRKNKTKIV